VNEIPSLVLPLLLPVFILVCCCPSFVRRSSVC
jgi:hypothetical protein